YEAADVDGANWWYKVRHVTLPSLSPVILFNVILAMIASFQFFTQAFIITNGGPLKATMFYSLYLYQNAFSYLHMGYASGLAWLVSMSLKPESQLFATSVIWIPHPVMWSNYAGALNEFPFLRYFTNTMIICIFVVIGATASSAFIAYGFSRVQWPGREVLFVVV